MTDDLIKHLEEVELEAKDYGFYWPDSASVMEQIYSECKEVDELLGNNDSSTERLKEEIGDLMHAVFSLCVFCGFDSKDTLEKALNKFKKRFERTKYFAQEDGNYNLHGKNMEEMMKYWKQAKKDLG